MDTGMSMGEEAMLEEAIAHAGEEFMDRDDDARAAALATVRGGFDPGRYLTKVGPADYLEVKWRLVWFRSVHPRGGVLTELVSDHEHEAVFRAVVSIDGVPVASGYGSEHKDDFRDYREKAETKAIGRALASAGFGTQFCRDFDFGAEQGRVVDAPVDYNAVRGNRAAGGGGGASAGPGQRPQGRPASDKQRKFLTSLAQDTGITEAQLNAAIGWKWGGHTVDTLPGKQASDMIGMFNEGKDGGIAEVQKWINAAMGTPAPSTAAAAGTVRPMSNEALQVWLAKIANATELSVLDNALTVVEERHGKHVPQEFIEALSERAGELEAAANRAAGIDEVPY